MGLYADLIREIEEGPSGSEIGAFFDLDHTLIATFSAFEFMWDALRTGLMDASDLTAATATAWQFQIGQIGFSGFVAGVSAVLEGHSEEEYIATSQKLFENRIARTIYPESRALVDAHRRKGHTLAVISASSPYQTEPIARDMRIPHVLSTRLQVCNGKFTGRLVKPTCYGEGKATHARRLARKTGIDLEQSYFYTDSDEDLPLLDIVGKPRPLNPNRGLREIAIRRGWPVRSFTSRGTPSVGDVIRTGLAIGSLLPSFALALPAIARGEWRKGINATTATWGELGTALAGVDLQVIGEANLWIERPAVFIFNHQSGIDMLLLAKMLRRDFVGIAKREILDNPIFGPAFSLAGTVFIDRADSGKAIEAMRPAIEALREGTSIVIAPEGTRSPTPRLGRFKKGAFYIARAAGVPIVPIVFRNALDALPKHGTIVRPATIEVVVLPPIPTADWTKEEINDRIGEIHSQFRDVLGD